jgi:hypothetical protein
VPKRLHKPAHRTIIVQFCSLKSGACERKSIRQVALGIASFSVEGTALFEEGQSAEERRSSGVSTHLDTGVRVAPT